MRAFVTTAPPGAAAATPDGVKIATNRTPAILRSGVMSLVAAGQVACRAGGPPI